MLSRHMNRDFLRQFRYGKRLDARGSYCQPAWIVPLDEAGEPRFDDAFALLTKDICPEGVSLIHTAPIPETHIWIGLRDDDRLNFVACRVQHSTPMGLGFFQIGLHPQHTVRVHSSDIRRLEDRDPCGAAATLAASTDAAVALS